MSNSLLFSRIVTLQSSSWFCFNYYFWLSLRCTWKKITTRVRIFYNHWIWNFSKFQLFSFPFFKFINFKITTNSFIYSLVEPFLETHFHKNNYRGKGLYFWKKLTKIFGFIYPLTWDVECILYEQQLLLFLGVRGILFWKNLVNFFGFIYPVTGGNGGILYKQQSNK